MLTNKGKLNLQKGDRYWTDLSIKGTWKKQSPKQTYSKKVKVNPKTIHKSDLYKVRPSTRKQTENAHVEHLKTQLNRGFTPKWYIVFHLSNLDAPHDDPIWDKYLRRLRNSVWTAIYKSNWKRKKTRARGIFSLEFGEEGDRPHINLLIEELPIPFNKIWNLFNFDIPKLTKGGYLWMKSADIQPYYSDPVTGYISKEMNYSYTSSVNYQISDYIP